MPTREEELAAVRKEFPGGKKWNDDRTTQWKARNPDYSMGRESYGDPIVAFRDFVPALERRSTCKIGSFCSISDSVKILIGGLHRPDWVTTWPFNILREQFANLEGNPVSKGDVIIGNDVWIGFDALILSGITVGDGAVIGARAVVTKDVPPYGIVAGNPARLIRKRFDDTTIARLLKLSWWNWEDEKINKFVPLMCDTNIAQFLDAAEKESAKSK